MFKIIKNGGVAFYIATKRFFNEDYTYRASALTYTVLLALVPLLATIVYVSSYFPIFSDFVDLTKVYIWKNIVPASIGTTERYFQSFISQASQLPFLGVVFLFITALMMVNTIDTSLNESWKVTRKRKRFRAFFFYGLSILLTPIILGLIIFLIGYVLTFSFFGYGHYITFIVTLFLPFIINTLLFTVLYKLIPNTKVYWRHAFFGGVVAGLLFELTKLFFGLYVQQFSSYEFIYGVFAIIPIFLIWLYFFWCIILFGSLVSHSVSQYIHH